MTHPHNDPELLAIVGQQPHEDAIWCDECCRWEAGLNIHDKPEVCPRAQEQLHYAAWYGGFVAVHSRKAMLLQAKHLVDLGLGFSKGREPK